jgi:L-malate glycosyltransferase
VNIALSTPVDLHALAGFSGSPTDGVPSGMGSTATTPLILEMLRRGHQVDVFTLHKGLAEPETYRWGNLNVFVGPCRQKYLARDFFRPEIACLTRAIAEKKPRFIHAHWTYEFALAAIRSGIPTVTTIHDLPWRVFQHFRDAYRFVRLLMAYDVALHGQYFTAVSNDAAAHFRKLFNPAAKISVIANGLPETIFTLGDRASERRMRGPAFATVLQGWSRQKNPEVALMAFQIARQRRPAARLLMFGAGYEKNGEACRWATRRKLDAGVDFIGSLPRHELLRRLKDETDILLHPCLHESFSLTAAEAMALRIPVIAGRQSTGVREVLGFGRGGVLVDVTDPAEMASQMVRLAEDASYRESVAENGFARAASLYRIGTVVDQYESFYRRVLNN